MKQSLVFVAREFVILKVSFFCLAFALVLNHLTALDTLGQVNSPDREFLFLEDRAKEDQEKVRREEIRERRRALENRSGSKDLPFDISAGNITFDSARNKVVASDYVVIGHLSGIIEAQSAEFDIATNEVELQDDVRITEVASQIEAKRATVNLLTTELDLEDAYLEFDEGGYKVQAQRVQKAQEDQFTLVEPTLTTCNCPNSEDCAPWELSGDEARITREGYGEVWNATLEVEGVPVFYFPYIIFPVKSERQSGFLPATIGYGSRSGFQLQLPFFWAMSHSTDATITPVLETEVRKGGMLEFRSVFSRQHNMEAGFTYLDESARGGDLLGTDVSDLADPTIDENRLAGFWEHSYSGEILGQGVQFIADARYISDDLLLREFENERIGRSSSRYLSSRAALRSMFLDRYTVEVSGEYNQSLVNDDDFVFQRVPDVLLAGLNTFRPFGDNALGAKLVLSSEFSATRFQREESFDGTRAEIHEKLRVPFHYKNYLDAEIETELRATSYMLDETDSIDEDGELIETFEDTTDRVLPILEAKVGTIVERVYELPEDSWFKYFGELGNRGRENALMRVKHEIEPQLKYLYVPFVDQSANPQFDSNDRLERKNIVTYELNQRLYGRYLPRNEYLYGIEETAPRAEDFQSLGGSGVIDDALTFGVDSGSSQGSLVQRKGRIEELASLKLTQSFDIRESNRADGDDPLSDLGAVLNSRVNDYFGIRADTNYDAEEQEFRSYTVGMQLADKRGDELRTRLRFIEDSVTQLESSVQINVLENMKLGYYSRYDDREGDFIEHRGGIRFESDCDCWIFDIQLAEESNPDETSLSFNMTLVGLGDIGNSLFNLDETSREKDSSTF